MEDEEGFVMYDGGSYSRGPIRISPEPGDFQQLQNHSKTSSTVRKGSISGQSPPTNPPPLLGRGILSE